ncbi:MAG: aminotransferase class I/II-fold pyridoxal phosphate-dependent enzyme [Selenomonadaceae bacterium]|nr:aminotransferase class I/II-fold pyridoxal phosphate-dependent enzyme [Selenomonadaceae bacterium]
MLLNAPIADAMQRYSDDRALAFHTPGHKQGLGAHQLLRRLITDEGLRQEVSLMDELDDLHDPRGIIDEAQQLAAQLWHADHALFFVNGTTSAVQTMIMSTVGEGDTVLVPRNAHRCVSNALILSGAKPVFLCPEFDHDFDIALNITPSTVEQAVEQFPNARALVITSPNYYGVPADLKSIAEIAHRHGMLLLVDEAHGAHLQFSARLPISAMDAGADIAAQSTHKLLGSLTQTSMLMINSARIDLERVRRVSSMLQSTSPNYLLLASLDIARLQMQSNGSTLIEQTIDRAQRLREAIRSISGLRLFETPSLDPTKITVDVRGLGLTGLEAEHILRHQLKIQCELSDPNNVLFLVTYADTQSTLDRLLDALKKLSSMGKATGGRAINRRSTAPLIIEPIITPRQAFYSSTTTVALRESIGRISAEEITFYPPGIPLICPGELITAELVDAIEENMSVGRRVVGAADKSMLTIRVI